MKRICVFCGANTGRDPIFRETTRALGEHLVDRGIGVVFGAGKVGLMGVLADAVLAKGGEAIGVIPHGLMTREVGHEGCTELHIVDSMHERKQLMHSLSDAFITMPGGYGSFEELLETITWAQLGIHGKPCGVLNLNGYYDPLLAQLDRAVAEGFIHETNRKLVVDDPTIEGLIVKLEAWTTPIEEHWLDPSQT